MLLRPQVPVIDHGAGQQDPDPTGQRGQHRKPPGPAVDRFEGGVEAHHPAPEQGTAFRRRAAIGDLFNLAFAAIAAQCEDRRPVHREQYCRPIEEDNRERVERVVEQVAIDQREIVGPIEVAEDAVRHRLRPVTQQHRANEAQHQEQPDCRGEGPRNMHPHAQRLGPHVSTGPPAQHRDGQERAGQDEPAAFLQRHEEAEAIFRPRRIERKPEQLAHEGLRVPAGLIPEIEPDDQECCRAECQREGAEQAEIDRADLGLAQLPHPVVVPE